jgi:hypothetical protein
MALINRGTGAGGSNTNASGLPFEEKTSNEQRLLNSGFVKHVIDKTCNGYYLSKRFESGKELIFMKQAGLRKYLEKFMEKTTCFNPDEAYLWKNGDSYTLRIIEKKNQNVAGSVDTKLLAGPTIQKVYAHELGFEVQYAFCVSKFLDDTITSCRWQSKRKALHDEGITFLFGDNDDYFTQLDDWIYS